jgi:hypothetical protein
MTQVQQSVDIAQPLKEVFAFVGDPANDALWGSALVEVEQVTPGPLAVGTRFRYVVRFAGRQFETVREVTEYDPNHRLANKTISGPIKFEGARVFEAIEGGTRVTLTGGGRSTGFFGPAEPLVLRAAKRALHNDLISLKRLLEDQSQA